MSTIKVSELRPTGADLFQDTESYLNELSAEESGMVNGGDANIIFLSVLTKTVGVNSQASFSIGISLNSFSAVTAALRK